MIVRDVVAVVEREKYRVRMIVPHPMLESEQLLRRPVPGHPEVHDFGVAIAERRTVAEASLEQAGKDLRELRFPSLSERVAEHGQSPRAGGLHAMVLDVSEPLAVDLLKLV